jgi:hypothetical protein
VSPDLLRTCSAALQYAQQLQQRGSIKPAPHFDPPPARQRDRQAAGSCAFQRHADTGHLHCQPTVPGSCLSLPLSLPFSIACQRCQAQPLPPAKLNLAQATRFVCRNYLLGLCPAPAPPDFYPLRLVFVHLYSTTSNLLHEQMGCSDAYC